MHNVVILYVIIFIFFFAQNRIFANNFPIETFKYYDKTVPSDGIYKYKPNELKITRKYYNLKSKLKKDYLICVYCIKNQSSEKVRIKIVNGQNSEEVVKFFIYKERKKYSKTAFKEPIEDIKNNFNFWDANNGLVFFFSSIGVLYNTVKIPFCVCKSALNTIFTPYYKIRLKADEKMINDELLNLDDYLTNEVKGKYILEPGEKLNIGGFYTISEPYPEIQTTFEDGRSYFFKIK